MSRAEEWNAPASTAERGMVEVIFSHFDNDKDGYWNYTEAREAYQMLDDTDMSFATFKLKCEEANTEPAKGWNLKHVIGFYSSPEVSEALVEHYQKVLGVRKATKTRRDSSRSSNSSRASVTRHNTRITSHPSNSRQVLIDLQADQLYSAMNGFGTDEDAVFQIIAAQTSQSEWDYLCDTFSKRHPKFNNGNLIKSLEKEFSSKEMKRAIAMLESNGIQLHNKKVGSRRSSMSSQQSGGYSKRASPHSPVPPDQIAADLHAAMKGFGTNEEGIFRYVNRVQDQEHWKNVQQSFAIKFPSFKNGELIAALQDELTTSEFNTVKKLLASKGISMIVPKSGTGKNTSGTNYSNNLADDLFKAMKGFGTDEALVMEVLKNIKNTEQWGNICQAFATRHSDFHGGDLTAALFDELTADEFSKCQTVLAIKGIPLHGPKLSHTAPLSKGNRKSQQQQHQHISAHSSRATCVSYQNRSELAALLFHALSSNDFPAVLSLANEVVNRDDWLVVMSSFSRNYPNYFAGDLPAAIQSELNPDQVYAVKDVLASKGITLFGDSGRKIGIASSNPPSHSTYAKQDSPFQPKTGHQERGYSDSPNQRHYGSSANDRVEPPIMTHPLFAQQRHQSQQRKAYDDFGKQHEREQSLSNNKNFYSDTSREMPVRVVAGQQFRVAENNTADCLQPLFVNPSQDAGLEVRLPFGLDNTIERLETRAASDFSPFNIQQLQEALRTHAEEKRFLDMIHENYNLVLETIKSAMKYRVAEGMERLKLEQRGYQRALGRHKIALDKAHKSPTASQVPRNTPQTPQTMRRQQGDYGSEISKSYQPTSIPTPTANDVMDAELINHRLEQMIATDYSDRQVGELRELASTHTEEINKFRELLLRHNDVEVSLHDTIRYKLAEESERMELDRRGRDRVRDWKMNELMELQQELDGAKPTVMSSTPDVLIRVPAQHHNVGQNSNYQHSVRNSPISPVQGKYQQQQQQQQQYQQGNRIQREYQPLVRGASPVSQDRYQTEQSNGLVNSQGGGVSNISVAVSEGDAASILNDFKQYSPVRSDRGHQPGKVTTGSCVTITTNPDSLELLSNLVSCKFQPHLCGTVGVVQAVDKSGSAQVAIHNVGVETIPAAALQLAPGRQQQGLQSHSL